jgi:alpha-methylacyl-CoA racemase
MMLSDLGAEVLRIERPHQPAADGRADQTLRGRRIVQADLKDARCLTQVCALIGAADVLIDGFRAGVTERLGIGPENCLGFNPRLIYGRMTGWGQDGPLSLRAGHDINYLSLTGVLHALGGADRPPPPPLNLVADFGGGSMFLMVGILSALVERERSGYGQVIDAAMVDGVSSLAHLIWSLRHQGEWNDQRENNILDGAAPFYATYRCADGKYFAVGAIEPEFYAQLLVGLELMDEDPARQNERSEWPRIRALVQDTFARRTRDEWSAIFEQLDACASPVLEFSEAPHHPHMSYRRTLVQVGDAIQPAPAPRFSRSHMRAPAQPPDTLEDLTDLIHEWTNVSQASLADRPG